jgi:hypothetical protein
MLLFMPVLYRAMGGRIINDSAAGLVAKKLIFNMIDFK